MYGKKGAAGAINDGADGLAGEQKDQGPSGSLPPAALTKFHGDLQNLLGEVAAVKRHQAIISAELRDLQNTNRQLWHETIANRANHEKNGDMIDKILKFLAGVFGGRVLGEGGSNFSTGNIQAANTNSGLGLDSYNQRTSNFHDPTQASEPAINRKRVERHNSGLELVPAAKRQRLLLKDSPKKGASASSRANQSTADHNIDSYFEELHSDEDVPANTIRDDASTSVLSMTNSPVERPAATFEDVAANQGAGMPSSAPNWNIDNTTQQPVPVPPLNSNFPTDNYANGNFAIDWPAINSYLNDPNSSSRTNALPDYSSYNFPDPTALLQSIGYVPGVNSPAPLQPEGHDGLSIQPQNGTPLSSFALALSPQNGAYQSNQQQMHSYDSALDNAVSENARLKERMDSLNTAINKLVAQMPQSFDPSATSLPANNTYSAGIGDDFDFSQYCE
ncbi:Heat shock transcription factor [Cystobasidiomycetes sp. EMM_F5]